MGDFYSIQVTLNLWYSTACSHWLSITTGNISSASTLEEMSSLKGIYMSNMVRILVLV